ncbi:AAA family ATPase, partial [bacterium]|nr:AAA family ATPase [bacterium]
LLKGARQTGKTTLLLEFGKNEYKHIHYFNFEMDQDLAGYFQNKLDPENIIQLLKIHSGESILPDNHLIIFDEIQNCPRALNSLKYFAENAPEYHVAAAGSLLGLHLSRPTSFPVGKVQIMDLYPMTFEEFLWALGEERYLDAMKQQHHEFPEPFHDHLIERLKQFMITGGMPEVIGAFIEQADLTIVRDLQRSILDGYQMDFAKHPGTVDPAKLALIWQSIPHHLSRENQRFIFSALKK